MIHPQDRSTDFLSKVYENLDGVTLVRGGVTRNTLRRLITTHDQVMMMGHGTPTGLMSVGMFPHGGGFVIDDSTAELLAQKDNSVFIWCNADQYVKYNKLKGFYTGMFVSEVSEAHMMGLGHTEQHEVDASNDAFVNVVNRFANHDTKVIHAAARHEYGQVAKNNRVAQYNHARLYAA